MAQWWEYSLSYHRCSLVSIPGPAGATCGLSLFLFTSLLRVLFSLHKKPKLHNPIRLGNSGQEEPSHWMLIIKFFLFSLLRFLLWQWLWFIFIYIYILVHQLDANHAPGVSVTQVNHSVHTLSIFLKIRADPSRQIFWIAVTAVVSDTYYYHYFYFYYYTMYEIYARNWKSAKKFVNV